MTDQTESTIPGARIVVTKEAGETLDVFVTDPSIYNEIGAANAVRDGAIPL